MSDIDDQMAEWRKTVWGTGPCPDSYQENFTLTDKEREALTEASDFYIGTRAGVTLRGLLERLSNPPSTDRP